jgi:hypothetical protein
MEQLTSGVGVSEIFVGSAAVGVSTDFGVPQAEKRNPKLMRKTVIHKGLIRIESYSAPRLFGRGCL